MVDQYKIFISHSESGTQAAARVLFDLQKKGARGFLDRIGIISGDIEESIINNLSDSNELWVMINAPTTIYNLKGSRVKEVSGTLQRPYVWLEVGVAWYREIQIVPILIGDLTPEMFKKDDEIPFFLRQKKAIHLYAKEYDALLDKLSETVNANRL